MLSRREVGDAARMAWTSLLLMRGELNRGLRRVLGMSKLDQEWETFSDARKREEVRHRGERVVMTTMAGVQWLTLAVVFFLTLAAFSTPTTPGQQALLQFAIGLLLLSGFAAVAGTILSGRDYQKWLRKL